MAVVGNARYRLCAFVEVEFDPACVRVKGVLPEFGNSSGAISDLLAAKVVDGSGAGLERGSVDRRGWSHGSLNLTLQTW